jgi:hypothetical protein
MMPRGWVPVLLVLLTGCGGTSRVVRLETGRGAPRVFPLRTGATQPVRLSEDDFGRTVAELARSVRPTAHPLRDARRLFEVPPRSGAYLLETRSRRLVPLEEGGPLASEALPEDVELTRAYGRWCERKSKPGDCLRLLEGGSTLKGDGKYALAMALAMDAVWDETGEALGHMAERDAVLAALISTATMYFMLWVLPEPVSKGLAATLTVALMAYLGIDTVWGLIGGWVRLVEEVDRATTFDELRASGERYGEVMGQNAARIFVMLATATVGHTGAHLAARLPTLPGATQAAVMAEAEVGVLYGAVAQVQSVALTAEGLTLALAPGAVAMADQGDDSGDAARQAAARQAPGQWVRVKPSAIESANRYQEQVTGRPASDVYKVDGIEFDGFKDGVLLEAKGPGYRSFFQPNGKPMPWYEKSGHFDQLMNQAQRQSLLARQLGLPLRWHVADAEVARFLRRLFATRGLPRIEVVHTPALP